MKCLICILQDMVNEPLTEERLQAAVDGARPAVTCTAGEALCSKHFFEDLIKTVTPEFKEFRGFN